MPYVWRLACLAGLLWYWFLVWPKSAYGSTLSNAVYTI